MEKKKIYATKSGASLTITEKTTFTAFYPKFLNYLDVLWIKYLVLLILHINFF